MTAKNGQKSAENGNKNITKTRRGFSDKERSLIKYGYARCSTNETRQDISRQERELKTAGVPAGNIFLEYKSGSKVDRRELNRLLETAKPGDTIVATEVSRITRSTQQLCSIIQLAKEQKLQLELGTFVIDFTAKEPDPMTLGMLQMMGVFAELERNMISQRVKSGMENARAKGKVIGRQRLSIEQVPAAFFKHYQSLKDGRINKTELARVCGISRPAVYRYINLIEGENKSELDRKNKATTESACGGR